MHTKLIVVGPERRPKFGGVDLNGESNNYSVRIWTLALKFVSFEIRKLRVFAPSLPVPLHIIQREAFFSL